ncbi:hypothetical protein [Mesorhizobium sp. M0571]|uniref:hypothetical protein n=1 Tax=Mesorhizobium sp. M0571 TaxID=2956960 RepID=UPI003335FE23
MTDWVRAPIDQNTKKKHYDVEVACDLVLEADNVVQKRIVISGAVSGVTIDCNGATLNGGIGSPNDGKDMIDIRSTPSGTDWLRPTDITIRDCNVIGSIRIQGMGQNGEADAVRESSQKDDGHVGRLRRAAPTRIVLDHFTITSTERTALYVSPGVTRVSLLNSELNGNGTRGAIYLDAESGYNLIKDNKIHVKVFDERLFGINRLGPQISVDTSSYNRIIGNRFSALEGGGVWLYRNCGYRGTVHHGTPSHNQIINNIFFYDHYDGANPSVLLGAHGDWWRSFPGLGTCDDDDGFEWGSSISNDDHATDNVVMQNRIIKRLTPLMIREGDSSNRPNLIAHNETVDSASPRRSGCYIRNSYKDLLLDGHSWDVREGPKAIPVCMSQAKTCSDGELTSTSTCSLQEKVTVCAVDGNNQGCQRTAACPAGKRIVSARAACTLETSSVTSAHLSNLPGNVLAVIERSDTGYDGVCWLGDTSRRSGQAKIVGVLGRRNVEIGCKEYDANGGDCEIRATLYCTSP